MPHGRYYLMMSIESVFNNSTVLASFCLTCPLLIAHIATAMLPLPNEQLKQKYTNSVI